MARVTVEDCTDKIDNLFDLVLVTSRRARQLAHGQEPGVPLDGDKVTVLALREVAAGQVDRSILAESDEPSESEIFTLPDVDEIEVDMSADDDDEGEFVDDGGAKASPAAAGEKTSGSASKQTG